ncbi:hypothetical protein LOAG_13220 [Loa loa]|uniref:Uncharacterized protein n=1 Tax=Loa loa TaxID=7209 RepID=A0A1S0TJW7_LOALO|nr:hypothetical protein LOAG_13220 [Loa loa]EFO15291.1 hypothetical protein LOAG_13220 [Loa loa]
MSWIHDAITLDCCSLSFANEALILATKALMAQTINAGERSSIAKGRRESLLRRYLTRNDFFLHYLLSSKLILCMSVCSQSKQHLDDVLFFLQIGRIAWRQRWWKRSRNPDSDAKKSLQLQQRKMLNATQFLLREQRWRFCREKLDDVGEIFFTSHSTVIHLHVTYDMRYDHMKTNA